MADPPVWSGSPSSTARRMALSLGAITGAGGVGFAGRKKSSCDSDTVCASGGPNTSAPTRPLPVMAPSSQVGAGDTVSKGVMVASA